MFNVDSGNCRPEIEMAGMYACLYKLTPREEEVCRWLLAGKSVPEIAMILGKGSATVKQQTLSVYRKLDVASRAQLFARYVSDSKSFEDVM